MTNKSEIGRIGEDLACEYLKNKGFQIIERNFRKPWGEIDIIAKEKNGALVFVEVKTMRQFGNAELLPNYDENAINPEIIRYARQLPQMSLRDRAKLRPEDNLTKAKLTKLQRTASLYAGTYPKLINESGWRIDLIAIALFKLPIQNKEDYSLSHFENL